jgi:hypothetical protein
MAVDRSTDVAGFHFATPYRVGATTGGGRWGEHWVGTGVGTPTW